MPNSKQIVYLSQAQYQELITNQSITVNGVTVNYDENDIYVTPQAEPVTDVRVNGTSIASNGVANVPVATADTFGVVKVADTTHGIGNNNGLLYIANASGIVKAGTNAWRPLVPSIQHESTFYGLAKVAGHDEASSTESVGTYTPEAKGAIQQMLGVSDLIATAENSLVASKAYAIGDIFTANGKLYKATAAIAADNSIVLRNRGETVSGANAEEIKLSDYAVHDVQVHGTSVMQNGVANVPEATNLVYGAVKLGPGFGHASNGTLTISSASSSQIKAGTNSNNVIKPENQHESTFYGLAKAAGDTTQAESDNVVGTYTDDAKTAIRTMLGAVGTTDYASTTNYGIIKVGTASTGLQFDPSGYLKTYCALSDVVKAGTNLYQPIVPAYIGNATFYGLAKAAGDTTQSVSANAVGTYTDNAKASIKAMLGIQDGSTGTVEVSGATPTITAVENTRYVCGEVTSLSFTPAASGICIVRFTSGSTVTVLTLPNTVKFPEWFDPTSLETNTIYEICITDGVYGAVMSWAL